MRVLVTGGTGFIGSQLAAALIARGDTVRILHRASSNLVALEGLSFEHCLGDILDTAAVANAAAGCDVVFHVAGLANYWREQRSKVYRVNVDGTRSVMQACLQARVPRVVHTSSAAAIGVPQNGRAANEDMEFDDLSASFVYGDSKHRAEDEVRAAVAQGLDAVMVNPAVVIGAGDHHLISGSLLIEMNRGWLPGIPPGGVCMVDVDAVVQGHLAAAERGRAGERYILGGENLSDRQVAETIADVLGKRAPVLTLPRWSLNPIAAAFDAFNRVSPWPPVVSGEQIRLMGYDIYYDSSKAVRELGYSILPFRGAVAKALRWYKEHGYL